MPLDVPEADFAGVARNPVALDLERSDAQGFAVNLMVKALQRDDPLRRSYLLRRWHGHLTPVPHFAGGAALWTRVLASGCARPTIDRMEAVMASEVQRLTKALAFAAEAHRNHRRKGASQEPYINHLIEVVDLVASVEDSDMDVLIAALLHDVLEDTRTTA
jgi:hypothetical protein